jgi:lipopolysaccharide transport system permease protein
MSCITIGMLSLVKKLNANRNLLKNLIVRDLKHRYVGSIGGFLWSVIHPVVLLISYTFIFTMLGVRTVPGGGTVHFSVFLLCGLLPWMLFSDTVVRNCSAISDNAPLITKTIIPAEILPISITISNLVHHLIGLGIVLVVLEGFYSVHISVVWIVLYMTMLLMFAQGLGWIVAGLHVFVRDTIQALQIAMLLWFYFTPILFPMEMINRAPKAIRFLSGLNPMAVIVTGYRNSLLDLAQPGLMGIAAALITSIVVFFLGAFLFRQAKPAFADIL